MTTKVTHAERAKALLDDPDRYQELAESYDDDTRFYEKTRSKIPKLVDEFEEYLSYHQIFIDKGPTEYVYWALNRNTDRSIKNMITGGSDAGNTFRIYTLEEAAQRVRSYQELGVETTLYGVVTTLLEELYEKDDHQQFVYPVLSTILSRVPSSERNAVELAARARLVNGLTTSHNEQQMIEELAAYLDVTSDPRSGDDRTTDELLDEINSRSFDDPELVELYESALRRDPSLELLSDYLYFSGRDVVERYRHRELKTPTVSELLLSEQQFAQIQEFSVEREKEDRAYIQSYQHLACGIYESGREWQSEQDPRKTDESNFMKAAQEYLRAAATIKQYNDERYIKYLNKSFRHAANATDSWRGKIELYDCAGVALIEVGQEISNEDVDETIADSKQLHDFWTKVAESYVHLEQGDPSQAHQSAIDAEEELQEIDTKQSSYLLKRAFILSEGLILEKADEYQDAVSRYSNSEINDEVITTRENIAQIKSHLQQEELTDAVESATSNFTTDSLIANAVRAIADSNITSHRSHGNFPSDLIIRDTESTECQLQSLLSLYVGTDEFRSLFRSYIRLVLLEL